MEKIKVTIVCSSLIRLGPTNVIYNMLEAYYNNRNGNIKFIIVTISEENNNDTRIEEFKELGIPIICCKIKPGLYSIIKQKKIRKTILSTNPDIVLSYGFRCDCVVGLLNLKNVYKVSTLFNNPFDDFRSFGKAKGQLMAKTLLAIYKKFDKVIVCSNFIANKIQKYGLPLKVIYTGVPSSHFVPNQMLGLEKRISFGIKPSDKIWIFIGNLIPRKNPLFLIDAFNKLKYNDQYLMIMGDGSLMEECKKRKGDNDKIILLGAQPGTLSYLQMADYYISSSFSEGFPTAVLEALSTDVIPLLSDIEPHIEMVEKFFVDCIFKNNDIDSLTQSMESIINNTNSLHPRDFLLKNYSSNLMQEEYVKLFNQIIKEKRIS